MKKLFAYAAIALFGAGALIVSTHSNAKSGGFAGGFKGKPWAFAKPHLHAMHPHHFAHAHDFDHHDFDHHHDFDRHHRFAHRFGFPGFISLGVPYAEPLIVEVPQETGDVTGSTEPRRVSVWRGNNADGTRCSAEFVTVPASQGGEATIRIIRC